MKILYCLKSTFNSGGMERIIIAKANHLAMIGNKVWIVTTDQRGASPFFPINNSISCVDLNINYDEIEKVSFLNKLVTLRKKKKAHYKALNALIIEKDPDIIISTFGNEIGFLPSLSPHSRKIAEIHFSRYYRLKLNQSKFRKLINRWISYRYKTYVKRYDAFITLTEEDATKWKGLNNLHVIPNFIENLSIQPAELENKRIISVGRFNYQKGFDRLINAFHKVVQAYPDWVLDLYGNGELKKELETQISKLGLEKNVHINDPIPNILDKIQESSIYVMSSRYEGLPMVLLEAISCGVPVISFNCECGPRDLLSSSKAGILVDEGNVDELASAICLLIRDRNLRKQMGLNAYQEAQNYLFSKIMDQWVTLFNNLMK